jgi:hypothetical protein
MTPFSIEEIMEQVYPSNKVTVKLSRPLKTSTGEVSELIIREPTVFDKLLYEKQNGGPIEKELNMIANLCGLEVSDLHTLPAYDYSQLAEVTNDFLKSPEKRSSHNS